MAPLEDAVSSTVAFVGLGNMGRPMAERLLEKDFALRVYNRTAAKAAPLAERGATIAATPAEAVDGADVVVTMLADDAALTDAALGPNGFVSALRRGALHISMSTVSPEVTRRIAEVQGAAGSELVAAPVMGRPDVAAAGNLWILGAGPPSLEEQCRPVFGALGRGHTWLGEDPGLACVAKIAANFMLVGIVELAAEALTLVEKQGLPPTQFFEIAKMLLPAPSFEGYAGRMLSGNYDTAGFTAALGLKDASLALGLAHSGHAPAPIASLARDRLLAALARGRGDRDLAVLYAIARENAGLE
jgi:3-hydroxyisobutyrate dehydrogenase-like beta-hydroxyacid dehydrogenase